MNLSIKMIFLFIMALLINVNVFAVILNNEEVEQADLASLQNETKVFQSIGMGIALSLAQCEGVDLCSLTVEESEIRELLNTLESRIGTLVLKQEEADDPAGLNDVLTAYMDERDSYTAHLEKLQSISSSLDEEPDLLDEPVNEEDNFPVESAKNEEVLDYSSELDAFEDDVLEDDELEDDEDLGDLPDLPELEDINSTP